MRKIANGPRNMKRWISYKLSKSPSLLMSKLKIIKSEHKIIHQWKGKPNLMRSREEEFFWFSIKYRRKVVVFISCILFGKKFLKSLSPLLIAAKIKYCKSKKIAPCNFNLKNGRIFSIRSTLSIKPRTLSLKYQSDAGILQAHIITLSTRMIESLTIYNLISSTSLL